MLSQRNEDHLNRAYELARLKHFEQALEEVLRALERDPLSAEAHICGAWIWRDQGRLPEAEQSAHMALALQPNSAAAHHILAVVLWEQSRTSEAETAFRDALRFNHPDQAVYLVNFGRMMNANYRSQEALTLAEQALVLAPRMSGAHDVRGLALARLGRTEEARTEYLEALRLNPGNAVAHNNLGVLRLGEGQAGPAAESFREALRLNPNDERARRNLVLALKAHYPLYRWVLALSRAMMSPVDRPLWRRFAIVGLGLLFSSVLVGTLWPSLEWIGSLLGLALVPVVLLTLALIVLWKLVADPLFNLLLLYDPLGRHTYEFDPVDGAVVVHVALILLGLVVALAARWLLGPQHPLWLLGFWCALISVCGVLCTRALRVIRARRRLAWAAHLLLQICMACFLLGYYIHLGLLVLSAVVLGGVAFVLLAALALLNPSR